MKEFIFKDYSFDNLYNDVYAIEPEISKELNVKLDEDYKRDLNKTDSYLVHRESSTIYELLNMHSMPKEKMLYAYNYVKSFYKDKFPLGSDRQLSGGNHFHIFLNQDDKDIVTYLDRETMKNNFYSLPLFGKFRGDKLYCRSYSWYSDFNSIGTGSKGSAVGIRSSYHSHNMHSITVDRVSLEFRCNNVYDARLYGFYIGLLIMSLEKIKMEKLSDSLCEYIKTGTKATYNTPDILLENIAGGRIMKEDQDKIKRNLKLMITVLRSKGLNEASDALIEYCNEIGVISGEVKTGKYFDSFLLQGFDTEPYIKIPQINLFRNMYTNLMFESEETYTLYIQEKLKKKLRDMGIPSKVISIDADGIKEFYCSKEKQSEQVTLAV